MISTLIAHRGLTNGPCPEMENSPVAITAAIEKLYFTECDIWFVENKWYLGHDGPNYEITEQWILEHSDFGFFHAKNLVTFLELYKLKTVKNTFLDFFFHDSDKVALSSQGSVVLLTGQIYPDSIINQPELWMDPSDLIIFARYLDSLPGRYDLMTKYYDIIAKDLGLDI